MGRHKCAWRVYISVCPQVRITSKFWAPVALSLLSYLWYMFVVFLYFLMKLRTVPWNTLSFRTSKILRPNELPLPSSYFGLLGCNVLYCDLWVPTFLKNILPTSLWCEEGDRTFPLPTCYAILSFPMHVTFPAHFVNLYLIILVVCGENDTSQRFSLRSFL